jgi:AcrR family transcriptional regulator
VAKAKVTAQRILETAIELFAERGFDQTSVRDITQAAEVNLAAINYHFGSRDQLIEAVAERYLTPLCDELDRQLDDYELIGTQTLSVELLIEALISAILKAVSRDQQGICLFMRLVSHAYLSADPLLRRYLDQRYQPRLMRFVELLKQQLPDISTSEFYWRCHFVIGAAVLPLSRHALLSGQEQQLIGDPASEPAVFHRLVSFVSAGLQSEIDRASQKRAQPLLRHPAPEFAMTLPVKPSESEPDNQ